MMLIKGKQGAAQCTCPDTTACPAFLLKCLPAARWAATSSSCPFVNTGSSAANTGPDWLGLAAHNKSTFLQNKGKQRVEPRARAAAGAWEGTDPAAVSEGRRALGQHGQAGWDQTRGRPGSKPPGRAEKGLVLGDKRTTKSRK